MRFFEAVDNFIEPHRHSLKHLAILLKICAVIVLILIIQIVKNIKSSVLVRYLKTYTTPDAVLAFIVPAFIV